ncbi:MAG: hypothetical protein PUF37_05775 [Prevotellaceae bacterium]|nr:hypothetical protein [Prevotellaceae bacterium]
MADTATSNTLKVGNVTFTAAELAKTFVTYRTQLIIQPMLAMDALLQHCSVRTGIRYREVVTEMSGKFEIGNYKKDKHKDADINFDGRVLETFFGNCIEGIDPNAIYQSIWGSNITKGDGLKNVPYVVQVCAYIMKKLGERLYDNAFTAKHDGTNFDETAAFFNGFKTIIDNDIAGTNENKKVYISEALHNLYQFTDSITKENAEDAFTDFYWSENLSPKLRKQQLKMFVSDINYHYYTVAYQTRHGSLPYNQQFDKKTLDGASNVELVPLSNVPKDFMLLTPKTNILLLYNQKTDDENYTVEKSLSNHYDLDFIANMFFGTQFESVSPEVFAVAEKKATA